MLSLESKDFRNIHQVREEKNDLIQKGLYGGIIHKEESVDYRNLEKGGVGSGKHPLNGLSEDQVKHALSTSKSSELLKYTKNTNEAEDHVVNSLHDELVKRGGRPTFKKRKKDDKTISKDDSSDDSDDAMFSKAESPEHKAKMEKVMKEFKEGTLKSSAGEKVTDRKQAVAIAMSEAKEIEKAAEGVTKTAEESLNPNDETKKSELKKAFEILGLEDVLEKAGEGSHGGKIIGHTAQGNPVYDNKNHPSHKNFPSWDKWDMNYLHEKFKKEKASKGDKFDIDKFRAENDRNNTTDGSRG